MSIDQKVLDAIVEGSVEQSTTFSSILEGVDLTPEFKEKLAEAFEAAVVEKAFETSSVFKEHFDKLSEELSESYETKFTEYQNSIEESMNAYATYTAQTWLKENELAVKSGLKQEITESFIAGLKGLFESSFIDIPEDKVDVVSEQEKTIDALKTQLAEAIKFADSFKQKLDESAREGIISDFTKGLTDTESERFKMLASDLQFVNEETFRSKLQTITEHYFSTTSKPVVNSVVSDSPVIEPQMINEHVDPTVAMYAAQISKTIK